MECLVLLDRVLHRTKMFTPLQKKVAHAVRDLPKKLTSYRNTPKINDPPPHHAFISNLSTPPPSPPPSPGQNNECSLLGTAH